VGEVAVDYHFVGDEVEYPQRLVASMGVSSPETASGACPCSWYQPHRTAYWLQRQLVEGHRRNRYSVLAKRTGEEGRYPTQAAVSVQERRRILGVWLVQWVLLRSATGVLGCKASRQMEAARWE
jgi:hypothetical protein